MAIWSGYALLIFGGGMIFSENRQPIFRIML
jgi:hypothetical protein